jgi:hypothetical protein
MPRWAQPPTKMRTPNPLVRLRMCIDATKAEARLACTFSASSRRMSRRRKRMLPDWLGRSRVER